MADASIITPQRDFDRTLVASVPTSYASIAIVTAKPTSGMLLDNTKASGSGSPSLLRLMPFSTSKVATGVGMRVIGWTVYPEKTSSTLHYVPQVLGDFTLTYTSGTVPEYTIDGQQTCTFSGVVQVAGTPPANAYSPASVLASNTEPCAVLMDVIGAELVTVQFRSSGTPTMGVFFTTI